MRSFGLVATLVLVAAGTSTASGDPTAQTEDCAALASKILLTWQRVRELTRQVDAATPAFSFRRLQGRDADNPDDLRAYQNLRTQLSEAEVELAELKARVAAQCAEQNQHGSHDR